jgi:hypothetical protein
LLLSRSRSKLEEHQSVPAPVKFVDAEQICLLNGAAAFLERKLFRQALENCDMVRTVISCVILCYACEWYRTEIDCILFFLSFGII